MREKSYEAHTPCSTTSLTEKPFPAVSLTLLFRHRVGKFVHNIHTAACRGFTQQNPKRFPQSVAASDAIRSVLNLASRCLHRNAVPSVRRFLLLTTPISVSQHFHPVPCPKEEPLGGHKAKAPLFSDLLTLHMVTVAEETPSQSSTPILVIPALSLIKTKLTRLTPSKFIAYFGIFFHKKNHS